MSSNVAESCDEACEGGGIDGADAEEGSGGVGRGGGIGVVVENGVDEECGAFDCVGEISSSRFPGHDARDGGALTMIVVVIILGGGGGGGVEV